MLVRSKNKTAAVIARQQKVSVIIRRSNKHFAAQVVSKSGVILAGATTKSKPVQQLLTKEATTGNSNAARVLGRYLAKLIQDLKIDDIAFNHSGYIYHGRVAAFVEGLRDSGIKV